MTAACAALRAMGSRTCRKARKRRRIPTTFGGKAFSGSHHSRGREAQKSNHWMTDAEGSPALDAAESAIEVWERVGLGAERHAALDEQGLAIADNQERSAEGREALKEVIREFKKVSNEERGGKVGGVIRAFQAEIDALTRRQSFAESAFLGLYRSLDDAPDPVPVLAGCVAEVHRLAAPVAEVTALRKQVADYDREFRGLTNQSQTIRKLREELKEAEGKSIEALRQAAVEREEVMAQADQAAHAAWREREAEAAAVIQRAQEEARAASRASAATQEQLFEMRSSFEERQAHQLEHETRTHRAAPHATVQRRAARAPRRTVPPHRTASHRTALHHTASHRTAPN